MPEPDPSPSNFGSPEKSMTEWGEKILQRFETVANDLSRSITSNEHQVKRVSDELTTLNTNQKSLLALYTTTASDIDELKAHAATTRLDNQRTEAAIASLSRSIRRIFAAALVFIVFISFILIGSIYYQKSMRDGIRVTSVQTNASQQANMRDMVDLRSDLREISDSVAKLSQSLDDVNSRSKDQASRLEEKLNVVVNDLEKSKGESFSQFMTQRTRLTRREMQERVNKTGQLHFLVGLAYQSLSSAKSARPSAVLAMPHDPRLDSIEFQILVKRVNETTLNISIASNESTLQAIEAFLRNDNGVIPLDLTIRTPIDR